MMFWPKTMRATPGAAPFETLTPNQDLSRHTIHRGCLSSARQDRACILARLSATRAAPQSTRSFAFLPANSGLNNQPDTRMDCEGPAWRKDLLEQTNDLLTLCHGQGFEIVEEIGSSGVAQTFKARKIRPQVPCWIVDEVEPRGLCRLSRMGWLADRNTFCVVLSVTGTMEVVLGRIARSVRGEGQRERATAPSIFDALSGLRAVPMPPQERLGSQARSSESGCRSHCLSGVLPGLDHCSIRASCPTGLTVSNRPV